MSQQEEFKSPNNQQLRKELMEEAAYTAYNEVARHKSFQRIQKSYNEQRSQYEEQAFSPEQRVVETTVSEAIVAAATIPEADVTEASGNRPPSVNTEPGESLPTEEADTSQDLSGRPETGSGYMGCDSTQWKSPSMREIEFSGSTSQAFGTAEEPELSRNTNALQKNERLQRRLEEKRRDVQRGYTKFSVGEHNTRDKLKFNYYGRIDLTRSGEFTLGRIGRLEYSVHTVREKMTRQDYENILRKKGMKSFKRRTRGRLLFRGVKAVAEEETLSEDEFTGAMMGNVKQVSRTMRTTARRNVRTIKKQNNIYARLDQAKQKGKVLKDKREKLLSDEKKKQLKDKLKAEKSRKRKKKLKRQMVQMRAVEEGNFFTRMRQVRLVKRRARKVRKQAVRRTLSTVFSVGSLFLLFLILGAILFLILLAVFTGGAEYYASAVIQNDYSTVTDATGYYRKLETDLDEYLNADREALETELEAEYGPDIYEYVYNLSEFGFSANTLIAYLSAVYGSFSLEDVKDELESIFEEMYTLTINVKLEDRVVSEYNSDTGVYEEAIKPKKICYVTLTKKELEDVVEPRMTEDQLNQYRVYRLSTGGQQVYGPVMREDWSGLISSNFGERIHPITKERKVHNGVDIAVPIGTHIYSAVEGSVILAAYSESAGNWIKVQNEEGWTVVMMHMDSLTVSEGQQVKRGDHLGYSGNTGRSTGPHLHLEVRNPTDQPLNPIFIIPQTCAQP